jgi:hypothetical protein
MKLSLDIQDFYYLEDQASSEFSRRSLGDLVSSAINLIFPIVGLAMLLYLIYGGFKYMTSRGDQKAVESAQSTITTAVIGFIVVFTSYWIVQIIGRVLGIQAFRTIF